jgi:DNA mismatch repair protein MutL
MKDKKINILSSEIYNKISAGEVVERPASVVKELVENSIDGGATKIIIEVEAGGIKQISVQDNGVGIEPEDVENAFLPHATSKISDVADLENIISLGFRGEALASIAAVSKVEMTSKTDNNDYGMYLELSAGKVLSKREVGAETGTKVVVKDLFFNTPARLKFLKKPKSEEGEITHLVSKLILANPTTSIRYIVDNKIIFNTFGNGLAEALYIIYGKEVYDNLLEVDYSSNEISLRGFIARPTYAKPNRTYQTLFVNGRLVTNYMISSAVQDAVDGFIMKGKFPLFALNLTIPYSSVDVNVHPTKQEVKFESPSRIYSIVNSAIYRTLSNANFIQSNLDINVKSELKNRNLDINGESELKNSRINLNIKNDCLATKVNSSPSTIDKVDKTKLNIIKENEGFSFSTFIKNSISGSDDQNNILKNSDSTLMKVLTEKFLEKLTEKTSATYTKDNENKLFQNENKSLQNVEKFRLEEVEINADKNEIPGLKQNVMEDVFDYFKIVGVLFETYILIEKTEEFYIIDQHAAHERQLYDEIMREINTNSVATQRLLMPFILNVNNKESEFILNNIEALIKFGIDIAEFGENTFKISAVPYILADINLKNFFDSILKDIASILRKPISIIDDIFARQACRAAVKAGDKLGEKEISILLEGFKKNGNVLLCPHGRPIVLRFDRKEVEKWFKRIV